jgi:hypothetical protein
MARFHAAVLVVGALLLAPSALALVPASSTTLPLNSNAQLALGEAGPTAVPLELPGGKAAPEPTHTVDAVVSAAAESIACRDMVRVRLSAWGGNVVERSSREVKFLHPWMVTKQEPLLAPQLPASEAPLLLPAAAGPLLRTAESIASPPTTYRTVTYLEDLVVHARLEGERIEWQQVSNAWLLTLAAGAPFLATGQGQLERTCGDNEPVLNEPPTLPRNGYRFWVWGEPTTHWHYRLVTLDAHMASAEEKTTLDRYERTRHWYGWVWSDLIRDRVQERDLLSDSPADTSLDNVAERPSAAPAKPATNGFGFFGSHITGSFAWLLGGVLALLGAARGGLAFADRLWRNK